ncbi:S8 family peptidase [Blastococcus sp. VKM Ac-2987]|uniref:S8 family peptidase n=1 Tax=Blastococcus sp. VKM Ac-2987 TaxID=3004141 RepID=UPI0022AB9FE6|nr:S8/S53 family peptidase [Blastococcus sp. VKM Ac-2987]MCZ2860657.1 S8/S53 family peptidase [Blastococcus sp. VKM Ac-2987]
MADDPGPDTAFQPADIIVALEHADTVAGRLHHLGVPMEERQDDADLGLARLPLPADAVGRAATAVVEAGHAEEEAAKRTFGADLDRLLWGLRQLFAAEYAGWTPTLGKNRLVGNVVGGGRISHGGGNDPRPAEAPAEARFSQDRLGPAPRIGVLDTGVDPQVALAGGWVGGARDVLPVRSRHAAVAGHGTFVTGLVRHAAPGCLVHVRQVLSDETGDADAWTVAQQIVALGRTGLDVLNLSIVCFTDDGRPPLVLATAVDRLDPDVVVVAAAGNHGAVGEVGSRIRRAPAWPAALDDVVAVGAADDTGVAAPITPTRAPWIDVLAPGMDVRSTYLTGRVQLDLSGAPATERTFDGYARWNGSSFAAALVGGAIAARTVPGRVPARQAWQQLRHTAVASEDGGPPFLDLAGP